MLAEKQKIEAVLDIMGESELKRMWSLIKENFILKTKPQAWDEVEIDVPTDTEKTFLANIDEDDYNFISQNDLLGQLNISPSELEGV